MTIEEFEKQYKELFTSSPLTSLQFYDVNEYLMKLFKSRKEDIWAFDGGVEFHFGNRRITLGWDSFPECYTIHDKAFNEQVEFDFTPNELNPLESEKFKKFIGKTIQDVDFTWASFEFIDPINYESMKLHYVPVELQLKFENDEFWYIALVSFDLRKKSILENFRFDIRSDAIVVSVNVVPQLNLETQP